MANASNWNPSRLSSIKDPAVRATLQSLKEFLNHPQFNDGIDVSDGQGAPFEHFDSTDIP